MTLLGKQSTGPIEWAESDRKDPLRDSLMNAMDEAERQGWKVKLIRLTRGQWDALVREVGIDALHRPGKGRRFNGATIEVVD